MPGIPPSPKRKEKHFLAWHGAVHLYRTWEDEAGDLEFEVSLVYTMIISPQPGQKDVFILQRQD